MLLRGQTPHLRAMLSGLLTSHPAFPRILEIAGTRGATYQNG
jgi:hypothetical protein